MKFEIKSAEDRKKAYMEIRRSMIRDIVKGRIPTFHVFHIDEYGVASNHYMTPISLEHVDEEGNKMIWIDDFEFFLRLLLRLRGVVEVEYDNKRPAIVFTYIEHKVESGILR